MGRKRLEVPSEVAEFGERLKGWRMPRPGRARIPEAFWDEAVSMARRHGACRVARGAGLGYASLRARLADPGGASASVMPISGFTELDLGLPGTCAELEFVTQNGALLRVRVPLGAVPDLLTAFLGATA